MSQRDLANLNNLFKKLNATIDKLDIFKSRAKELPDLELVQKKLAQFGAALGFVEDDLARKDDSRREQIEKEKLKKLGNQKGQAGPNEEEYIMAINATTFSNIQDINQILRRREIMTNINDKYIDKESSSKVTWQDKLKMAKGKKHESARQEQVHNFYE